MIVVKDLQKKFGKNKILKGINVTINKGEKIAILGPSGCGKSTFLRCLNLLETPTKGEIWINNVNIVGNKKMKNEIRKNMGMVFQNFNLFAHLTIIKNITLVPTVLNLKSKTKANEQALELLSRIGLSDKANMYPHQLSGGQKQRVAIIRALAMDPLIILFDEPTSSLDPEMVGEVLSLIKELSNSGMTMVIVTHEMGFAKEIANKILFMDDGLVIEESDPIAFFAKPKTPRAIDFLSKVVK